MTKKKTNSETISNKGGGKTSKTRRGVCWWMISFLFGDIIAKKRHCHRFCWTYRHEYQRRRREQREKKIDCLVNFLNQNFFSRNYGSDSGARSFSENEAWMGGRALGRWLEKIEKLSDILVKVEITIKGDIWTDTECFSHSFILHNVCRRRTVKAFKLQIVLCVVLQSTQKTAPVTKNKGYNTKHLDTHYIVHFFFTLLLVAE